jgi:hypothetical protein
MAFAGIVARLSIEPGIQAVHRHSAEQEPTPPIGLAADDDD